MKPRWWIPLFLVAVICLASGAVLYPRYKARTRVATYSPVKVVRGDLSVSVDASGTVVSDLAADIVPSKDGKVTKVFVKPGDPVKAGQALVLMDATDAEAELRQAQDALYVAEVRLRTTKNSVALAQIEAQRDVDEARAVLASARVTLADLQAGPDTDEVAQAEAAVNQAQLSYDAAKADYERMQRLYEAQAVTKQELDRAFQALQSDFESLSSAKAKLKQAKTPAVEEELAAAEATAAKAQKNLAIAEANLRTAGQSADLPTAEANLRKAQDDLATAKEDAQGMKLTAPFAGVVTEVAAVVGTTYVSSRNTEPLVSIAAPGTLVAEVEVNENDITQVKVGQDAVITMDAVPDEEFHGRVTTIGGLGHETDGVISFTVRIALTDASTSVKPGMSVDSTIKVAYRAQALNVPNGAIEIRPGRTMVRLYQTGGSVGYRRITTGLRTETATEILDGLREGETVAVPATGTAVEKKTETNRDGGLFGGPGGPPPR